MIAPVTELICVYACVFLLELLSSVNNYFTKTSNATEENVKRNFKLHPLAIHRLHFIHMHLFLIFLDKKQTPAVRSFHHNSWLCFCSCWRFRCSHCSFYILHDLQKNNYPKAEWSLLILTKVCVPP